MYNTCALRQPRTLKEASVYIKMFEQHFETKQTERSTRGPLYLLLNNIYTKQVHVNLSGQDNVRKNVANLDANEVIEVVDVPDDISHEAETKVLVLIQ